MDVSVPQLRCFLAVVDAGSLAEAARRLGMSAASVSKAISRLEASAGVRLLHRSTHALSLTADGERLREPAREAVRAAEAFEDAAQGDRGVVRITAAIGLARHVLAPLLAELDQRVEVRVTNEVIDLAEAGVDLALRTGRLDDGLIAQPWFRAPWVICAAPAYVAKRGRPASFAALADHDLIGFRNARTGRVQRWGDHEVVPRLAFDDGDAVFDAMLAGGGVACAPLYMAAGALRRGDAIELLADQRGAPFVVSIVRRERKLAPGRVKRVIEFLRARPPDLHVPVVTPRRRSR